MILRRLPYILSIVILLFVLTYQPVLITNAAGIPAPKPTATQTRSPTVTNPPVNTSTTASTLTLIPNNSCATSTPPSGTYSVTLCFTTPADGSLVSGNVPVGVSISVAGTSPGVQRMVFYINGAYLLTDYQSTYTFSLPTTQWKDGVYSIQAEALMRDAYTTLTRPTISLNFNNGIINPPVNNSSFTPSSGSNPANGAPFVVVAAGDAASGEINAVKVSDLVGTINPNLFLYLGDVYEKGSITEFFNWYGNNGLNFSAFNAVTNPTIGNHEYSSGASAPGYFDYWNNVPNYYSYNANGWHFISLNSNASRIGVDAASVQYQWLSQDLANNAQACTIVYYHHPLFNIGPEGSTTAMSDIWSLMSANGVSIVINGHDHDYQRWVPLDGNGQPSATGITEFVAGGSGHGLQRIATSDSRVAYANDTNPTAFGALKLELNSSGTNFSYVNINGAILDSGTVPCAKVGPDTQAPSKPAGLTATAGSATRVDLNWSAATDNSGVAGYTIYRNGPALTTVSYSTLTYADTSVLPGTSYIYKVDAFDAAGNHSAQSAPANVTTPAMPASVNFIVQADTYVNSSLPASNYGSATVFRLLGSPSDLHAYLRFNVQGLAGYPIVKARLLIYTMSNSSLGVTAVRVANNTWNEKTVNYTTAPPLGNQIASSGSFIANNWVTMDVTSYVTGEGTYSFGVTTPSSTTLSFAARESGANAAILILNLSVPDNQTPSTPTGLTANASSASKVDLSWSAATDNIAVTGYTVYRNRTALTSVSGSSLTYSDTTAKPATNYSYTVDAFDTAGNHSAQSAPASVTTPALPASVTFNVQADTYVNSSLPASKYGSATVFRLLGSSSDLHAYLRFNVAGLAGTPVVRARLRVYTTTNSSPGISAVRVADNSWVETAVTYTTAPPLGSLIAASGPITANSWVTIDVTPYITGDGIYSIGLTTTSTSTLSFAARESGVNVAQLIIDLQ